MTAFKPPSTFVRCSTVTSPLIIVFVFGGELHSVVITQRITSITLKYILSTEVCTLRYMAIPGEIWVDSLGTTKMLIYM